MRSSHSSPKPADGIILLAIFLVTLFAVFAYGMVTADTKRIFDIALAVICVGWVLSVVIANRLPRVRKLVFWVPFLLLIYGWLSVFNAGFTHDWALGYQVFEESWNIKWLPSTINYERTKADMIHLSALVMGGWMISDLCRARQNRKRLLEIIGVTGLVFALVGIFMKASGTTHMLFSDTVLDQRQFFASYRYHGNAATFLNFCWPVCFVILLTEKIKDRSRPRMALWASAAFFTFAAVFINTSKMGHALGLVMMLVFLVVYRRSIKGILKGMLHPKLTLALMGLVLVCLVAALLTLSFSQSLSRWQDLLASLKPRFETYQTCLTMIEAIGLYGMGPGTFSTAFPYFVSEEGREIDFFFHTAHQDYLQTIIEWGWLAGLSWLGLFFVILTLGALRFRKGSFYMGALLTGLAAVSIQAFVDFPAQIGSLQWIGVIFLGIIASPGKN